MGIANDWSDLLFDLDCLSKQSAKRKFKKQIRYGWGGLCAYCRCKRATTVDHLKAKSRGGSSLRSNLIPACRDCNHSKGSQSWLVWFQEQSFYNTVAQELIEEWITNKRFIEEELDDPTYYRTEVRPSACEVRGLSYEPTCVREDGLAPA